MIAFTGGVLGSVLTYVATVRTHAKSLFVQTVTQERAAWRRELREQVAALTGLVHLWLEDTKEANPSSFHTARVGILMRVNPRARQDPRKHWPDADITAALATLARVVRRDADQSEQAEAKRALRYLEANVQELLKAEWEKSKREAHHGRVLVTAMVPQRVELDCDDCNSVTAGPG